MDRRTIILIVVLFALIIAGMFTFAWLKKTETTKTNVEPTTAIVEKPVPYEDITIINAKHFFDQGTHTFVGEIDMPTPCDLVDVNAIVAESYPEQITLNFTVINNADACVQKVTAARFMVTANASEAATTQATFMGRPIQLNLIPPLPGESAQDFELFIKG